MFILLKSRKDQQEKLDSKAIPIIVHYRKSQTYRLSGVSQWVV